MPVSRDPAGQSAAGPGAAQAGIGGRPQPKVRHGARRGAPADYVVRRRRSIPGAVAPARRIPPVCIVPLAARGGILYAVSHM